MVELVLTVSKFRSDFDDFSNSELYPDGVVQSYIERAYMYCSNNVRFILKDDERLYAIELMTAHLLSLRDMMKKSGTGGELGQVSSTSIGSVSVSLVAPINRNSLSYWLNLTGYGKEYLALLSAHTPMGFYYGGSYQRVLK